MWYIYIYIYVVYIYIYYFLCPKHIIETANDNVHAIHREDILMQSSKNGCPDRIPLIPPFNLSVTTRYSEAFLNSYD